jgi:hypothetical protein
VMKKPETLTSSMRKQKTLAVSPKKKNWTACSMMKLI